MYLLEHDAKRWNKISPMKIWSGDVYQSYPAHMDWQEMAQQYAAQYMNQNCVAFEGRSNAFVKTMKLKALIEDAEINLIEGFISIVPGRLVLATNHEGGSWLMQA